MTSTFSQNLNLISESFRMQLFSEKLGTFLSADVKEIFAVIYEDL